MRTARSGASAFALATASVFACLAALRFALPPSIACVVMSSSLSSQIAHLGFARPMPRYARLHESLDRNDAFVRRYIGRVEQGLRAPATVAEIVGQMGCAIPMVGLARHILVKFPAAAKDRTSTRLNSSH